MLEPRGTRALIACIAATLLFTGLDLWSKDWAVRALSEARGFEVPPACTPNEHGHYYMQRARGEAVVVVPDYLELRYAENCGAAFGMLDEAPRWLRVGVFMTAGSLAVLALLWMFYRGNGGRLFAYSVPLVASGALGNMIDRVRLGYVVDFIHFHIYDRFEWPTFNIADTTITIGVALLLLDGMRRPEPAAKDETGSPQPEPGQGTRA